MLGGVNPKLYKGEINMHKGESDAYWMLKMGTLKVGNTVVQTNGARGIVDSGTSLLLGGGASRTLRLSRLTGGP